MKIFAKIIVFLYLIPSFSSFCSETVSDNIELSNSDYQIESDIETYSINLLCINKKLDLDQKHICSKEFHAKLIPAAIRWADENSEAIINIWYDSKTTHEDAVKASIELTEAGNNVQLKDIHDIKIVQLNEDIFSHKMPLYFRIDFLKLVICTNQIDEQNMDSAIFTDVGVTPMNKAMLFSTNFLQKLVKSGMLINNTENQFLQVIRQKDVVSSLKHFVSINLMRAAFALNLIIDNQVFNRKSYLERIYLSPFYTTVQDFHLYLHVSRFGEIKVNAGILGIESDVEWVDYDKEFHGYLPFGDIVEPNQGLVALSVGNLKIVKLFPLLR